ncbi:MAG: sensor histidine kinase, partial [Alphaproteobacteria bacterium]
MNEFMLVASPDGVVISGNRAMARALECRMSELPGRKVSSIISGNWDELKALADDDNSSMERSLIIPSNVDLPVQATASSMHIYDQITGQRAQATSRDIIILLKDITEQVRDQATIDHHIAELERSNADLEQFAYVASHDLKAPLRAIDILAGWIEEDSLEQLSESSREHLQLLRSRTKRLEALLEGLLQYAQSGREKASVDWVESRDLVADVVEILGAPAAFQVSIANDLPSFSTTKAPLQQVFHNLIGNAIKHHDKADGKIEITVRDQGSHFEFTVTDDGPGIDAAFHEKIFKMFQTLKRRDEVEGSGIGLAVVQKLVRAYGGEIVVLARPDVRDTAFQFTWEKLQPELIMENTHAA